MASSPASPKFDHLVVVMFENRSFDNLLGYLYAPGEIAEFEGVLGRELSNPIPSGLDGSERGTVVAHPAQKLEVPDPDPGEEYPHVNTQLYGIVAPEANATLPAKEMHPPFNAPPTSTAPASMNGFVADYAHTFSVEMGRPPTYEEYAQIMACHTPDELPVVSSLARGFACCDHWFCEVPTQTLPNRSFFHAGTSSGFVLDFPVENYVDHNDAPTIFERLEAAKLPWMVYVDPQQVVSLTGLIHARRLAPYFDTHFATIYDFCADAAAGRLPAYSFLEPNMFHPRSDMHPPGFARIRHDLRIPVTPAILEGEALLARVYNAVRTASSDSGSNWKNTLLIATFDEHGGTFDHVPPPAVPAPSPDAPAGQMGFTFERAGVRIPAILVSAWIEPRTVEHAVFRSCSVLRTLRERFSLGPPLTARDADARDLASLLTRETPRAPSDWPLVSPASIGAATELFEKFPHPLSSLGRHLFRAALVHEVRATGETIDVDPESVNVPIARTHLRRFRKAKFDGIRNGRQSWEPGDP
jgi:phospholipase C